MEETARAIAAKLREHNHIAFFAGGCVRDMVRNLPPKDIDIATDARPEEVQKLFPRTYAVGAHFGVIVVLENGFQVRSRYLSFRRRLPGRTSAERGSFFIARGRCAAARLHHQRNVFRSGEK
jgi:hypothetical protein